MGGRRSGVDGETVDALGEVSVAAAAADIWSTADRRHPVMVSLACIALANALVPVIWHDGYPHRADCPLSDCPYQRYHRMRMNGGYGMGGVIRWRRHAYFRLVDGFDDGTPTGRIAAALADEMPLWAVADVAVTGGIELVLADLRRLAVAVGVETAASALDQTRQYATALLGQITRRTPAVASSGGVQVKDRDAMMVELRRRLYRAHALAKQSMINGAGIGRGWAEFFRSFGPAQALAMVQQHKDLIARYDAARARVYAGIQHGVDKMTAAQCQTFALDQREFEVLGDCVELVAAIYQVRVVKEEW